MEDEKELACDPSNGDPNQDFKVTIFFNTRQENLQRDAEQAQPPPEL